MDKHAKSSQASTSLTQPRETLSSRPHEDLGPAPKIIEKRQSEFAEDPDLDGMDCAKESPVEQSDDCEKPAVGSHGGPRNTRSYDNKHACLHLDNICRYLRLYDCGCEGQCIKKLRKLGEVGEKVVYDLRAARFAGMYPFPHPSHAIHARI